MAPRFAGLSDVELGELSAKVEALEKGHDEIKKDVRDTRVDVQAMRESQLRMEATVKGAMRATSAIGAAVGALLTIIATFLGFKSKG